MPVSKAEPVSPQPSLPTESSHGSHGYFPDRASSLSAMPSCDGAPIRLRPMCSKARRQPRHALDEFGSAEGARSATVASHHGRLARPAVRCRDCPEAIRRHTSRAVACRGYAVQSLDRQACLACRKSDHAIVRIALRVTKHRSAEVCGVAMGGCGASRRSTTRGSAVHRRFPQAVRTAIRGTQGRRCRYPDIPHDSHIRRPCTPIQLSQ